MTRPVNVFGKPIEFDIGVTYINGQPVPKEPVVEGDDLSKETLTSAANIAASETSQNDFTVSGGSTLVSLTDNLGNPVPLSDSNSNRFVTSPDLQKSLDSYSNSSQETGTGDPNTFLNKGKVAPNGKPDGNQLWRNPSAPQVIETKYVSPVLSKNRFTSTKQQQQGRDFRINPDHPQGTLGSWSNYRTDPGGKDFQDGHLAHIGALLTLRSTRELLANTRTAYGTDGPDGTGADLASILPGVTQAGLLKVSTDDLTAKDVLNSLIASNVEPANLDPNATFAKHTTISINDTSYGQMNNVLEPFSGLLPLGMLGLSAALVLALKLAIKGILAIFLLITSASKSNSRRVDSLGRYFLGNYNLSAGFDTNSFPPIPLPASLFGLRETVHAFGQAVDKGVDQFFGGGIGDSFKRILETPGFYAVFCRTVVVSAASVLESIKGVVKGNPVEIVKNVIALVDIIKNSKLVSVLNVMAEIGDATLSLDENPAVVKSPDREVVSTIDSLSDTNSAGYKNRLNGKLQLAWANSVTPSAYLIPKSTYAALSVFSQVTPKGVSKAFPLALKNDVTPSSATGEDGRLNDFLVKTLESKLDAEYMPFYFHDLRTNEIISFPAFLTSLTDDFSVNWENSEAYGRVDPVKTYKSTARRVSLSFIAVATGLDDFDQMWVKINKLLTMVYPQWSEGTLLNNTQTQSKFIQPFSQVPSSSPIIRLRLGDLLRTNYSRFALARLFGVGQPDRFKIQDVNGITVNESGIAALDSFKTNFLVDNSKLFANTVYTVTPGVYVEDSSSTGGGLGAALGALASAVGLGDSSKPPETITVGVPLNAKITAILDNGGAYQVTFVDGQGNQLASFTKKYKVPATNIGFSRESLELLIKNYNFADVSGDLDAIKKFFSPDNSIVKSFESVGGKGMACAIDSINFNWLENATWETEVYGGRAPKTARISINLTPIHDIAPGLDSDGFNRAPIYNVGRIMNMVGGDGYENNNGGKSFFDNRMVVLANKIYRK